MANDRGEFASEAGFDFDLFFGVEVGNFDGCFDAWSAFVVGGDGDASCNPELRWAQVIGCDHGIAVSITSCMCDSAQRTKHNNIASGTDFCTGIEITEQHDISIYID